MPRKKAGEVQSDLTLWLLGLIEEYLTLNDMDNDGNTFGWLSIGDVSVVQRLRDGGDVTIGKMVKIFAFMQRPVNSYLTSARTGERVTKTLKPLTIKPKELP
jgi:hypothetical protein